MKLLSMLILAIGALQQCSTLSVSSDSSQSADINNPTNEGRQLTLTCNFQLGNGESFTSCLFRKEIPKEMTDNGESKHFACSLGSPCTTDQDQEISQIVSSARVDYQASSSGGSCSLTVNAADPKLRGNDWTCHVVADSPNNLIQAADQLDVYVSNQSEPIITQPDMRRDTSQTIAYSAESGYGQINAVCTAFNGVPPPQIKWFVDNVNNNEITQSGSTTITTSQPQSRSNTLYVESRLTFKPTLDDLCSTFNIQAACDVVNGDVDMTTIVFDLICVTDQTGFYPFPNNNNNYQQPLNQIKVEVSASWTATSKISLVVLAVAISRLFQ